jgi:hypothetical protein
MRNSSVRRTGSKSNWPVRAIRLTVFASLLKESNPHEQELYASALTVFQIIM